MYVIGIPVQRNMIFILKWLILWFYMTHNAPNSHWDKHMYWSCSIWLDLFQHWSKWICLLRRSAGNMKLADPIKNWKVISFENSHWLLLFEVKMAVQNERHQFRIWLVTWLTPSPIDIKLLLKRFLLSVITKSTYACIYHNKKSRFSHTPLITSWFPPQQIIWPPKYLVCEVWVCQFIRTEV